MGLPFSHYASWGLISGYAFDSQSVPTRLSLADHGRVVLPQLGAISLTLEGALAQERKSVSGALGLYLNLFGAREGIEWDTGEDDFLFRFSADFVIRRGGLFGNGERLRIDYVPARQSVQMGITLRPFWTKHRQNRPRQNYVDLPRGTSPPAAPASQPATESLTRVESALTWMDRLLTPRLSFDILDSRKERQELEATVGEIRNHLLGGGHGFAEEDSSYHRNLEEAFSLGVQPAYGAQLSLWAESTLLEQVILPFNRLFGQKRKPFELSGLQAAARREFGDRLARADHLDPQERAAAAAVFDRLLLMMDMVVQSAKTRWKDGRLVWLPLNYGLRPEQYDSQAELQGLLARLAGGEFNGANRVQYLMNDRWYYELRRMILETQYYQVLVIHDFAGVNRKAADPLSWGLVVDGYVEAFVRAIEALDRGERARLPDFTIFLDEHYFQANGSRSIMEFLGDLYESDVPGLKDTQLESTVRAAQVRLRETVKNSSALGTRTRKWLRQHLLVHVNITNASDQAYADDVLMRDHRKVAFRDVFEDLPMSGEAVFTGEGVGRSYCGPCWEDRSVAVKGDVLAELKTSVRELFLSQGYDSSEVPPYLQPRSRSADHEQVCDSLRRAGWTADVMTVMNETGFGTKTATITKLALYNLMLRGTVIIAPDSIWASDYWAGMFLGAALRGMWVYPITPAAKEQAPSNAPMTLELVSSNLACLQLASQLLSEEISSAGGEVKIGLYDLDSDVADLKVRLETFLTRSTASEPFKKRFGLSPEVMAQLHTELEKLQTRPPQIKHLTQPSEPCTPQLHLKVQLFINGSGWQALRNSDWSPMLERYFEIRRWEVSGQADSLVGITQDLFAPLGLSGKAGEDTAAEAPIFMMTAGSHNQDRRSMTLDGEVILLIGGPEALICSVDFALLMGTVHWVTSVEEIEAIYPQKSSLMRSLVKSIKGLI